MDNILSQQLLALGQDLHLRKQNILNLVPCLTQQEVRNLIARLSEVDFRTDIVSRLPPELRLNIAAQLGDCDVFPLLNVSRQWRAIWLQTDILKALSQRYRHVDTRRLDHDATVEQRPGDWMDVQYEFLRRRRRRCLGWFSSAIVVRHNVIDGCDWLQSGLRLTGVYPQTSAGESNGLGADVGVLRRPSALPPEHRSPGSSLYEGGRLVWVTESLPSPQNTVIVVEDLYNKTKKVYRNPSVSHYGRALELKALGDRLLVAGTSRVMFIWDLESNQRSQVFLPQEPTCCVTRGEYVAFLQVGSALLWKSGSKLTALDIEPLLERKRETTSAWPNITSSNTLGIFFHPSEEGTLYISVCFTYIRQVVVHKFTTDGYSGAQEISLHEIPALPHVTFDETPNFLSVSNTTTCRAIRPVNSSGDFLIAEWRTCSSARPLEQGVHVSGTTFVELRFNTKTDDFSLKEKSLPSGTWRDMQTLALGPPPLLHSWNDQMAFSVQVIHDMTYAGVALLQRPVCRNPALVVMPIYPPAITGRDARIHTVCPGSSPHVPTALSCVPRLVTVEAHLENKLDILPPTSLALVTEDCESYYTLRSDASTQTLKGLFYTLGSDAVTRPLKGLYAKSDFLLDLTPTLTFPKHGGSIEGPHHIFQDDDFIILFHRRGYIAWDFRPEAAST